MDSTNLTIAGSAVTALTLVIGFAKHQLDKKGAVREILEKQLDQCAELIVKKWQDEFSATLR